MTRPLHPADAERFERIHRELDERKLEPTKRQDWEVRAAERELLADALRALAALTIAVDRLDDGWEIESVDHAFEVLERARAAGHAVELPAAPPHEEEQ